MGLISKVSLKNFKCFREKIDLPINQGTYFIGINNAGKTAVLNAVKFFFDSSLFDDESFLNRTTYLAKKGGYNRSEITLTFDLSSVINKALKSKLIKFFSGTNAVIKKSIIFSSDSRQITSFYTIREKDYDFEQIDENIRKLLRSVKIIYIHPQEGRELLLNAQDKLRARLLANWGRGARLSHSIKELQDKWIALREQARSYLSGSLTDSLQKMWPGSEASIDLPKDVKDIVAISDITFKSHTSFPDIELTAQGTGAQATILYLTHFLLDSDRSLHRGEYHPIWLLEEPESFLHADLIAKFAAQMNSELWLRNIQMLVSTHSPIILAASRLGEKSIIWNLINEYRLKEGKGVDEWSPEQIEDIGKIMGDANFHVYFNAAKRGPLYLLKTLENLRRQNLRRQVFLLKKD